MKGEDAARGPASRGEASLRLFAALCDHYGILGAAGAQDLGGSSNPNLLLTDGPHRNVVLRRQPRLYSRHWFGHVKGKQRATKKQPFLHC